MSWLSDLLRRHPRSPSKKRRDKRAFESSVATAGLAKPREIEIYPVDRSARKPWFSLTIREREVAALVCMGYRNYEIATMLGIGYGTIQTYLQRIFDKFDLRSRKEIREALKSWPAEEWWKGHH